MADFKENPEIHDISEDDILKIDRTFGFLPPEQIENSSQEFYKNKPEPGDVWSLCMTFYYLCTQEYPIGDLAKNFYRASVQKKSFPKMPKHVSEEFKNILVSGLKFKPD